MLDRVSIQEEPKVPVAPIVDRIQTFEEGFDQNRIASVRDWGNNGREFVSRLVCDMLLMMGASLVVADWFELAHQGAGGSSPVIQLALVCGPTLILSLRCLDDLTRHAGPRWWREVVKLGVGIGLGFLASILFVRLSQINVPLSLVIALLATAGVGLCLLRAIQFNLRQESRNVIIVGAGRMGRALARHLDDHQDLGYRVKGLVDETLVGGANGFGILEALDRSVQSEFIDEIIITSLSERELVRKITEAAQRYRVDVRLVPEVPTTVGARSTLEYLGTFPTLTLHREPIPRAGLFMKRLLDVLFAGAILVLLSPLLAILALVAVLDSHGPAFYRSIRVGKRGRRFICYKFRTMVSNADELKEDIRHLNFRKGPTFKIADDPRVTRIGRFFRKYSLDELPQFWNVLVGDMSVVGPRPHPLDDVARYQISHMRRLSVKPGITGLWQVSARQDPSFETNMALDVQYIENWSFWLDVKIILKTVPAILRGLGQ